MHDLFWDLTNRFERDLARRPVPPTWTTVAPAVTAYPTIGDVAAAIRRCRNHPDRSDTAIRALLTIDDTDAHTTILWALAPILRRRLGSIEAKTRDYLNDGLTELALVLAEADNTTTGHELAFRLVNRARSRTHKLYQRDTHARRHAPLHTDETDHIQPPAAIAPDCAEVALVRVQLDQLRDAVAAARGTGHLTPALWDEHRDVLNQHLAGDYAYTTSTIRMRRARTRRNFLAAVRSVGYTHAA